MVSGVLMLALTLAQNPADMQQGKQLFEGLCADCHGYEGTGARAPSLNRPTLPRAQNDDALRAIRLFASRIADAILEGKQIGTEGGVASAEAPVEGDEVDVAEAPERG